jgi:hypothetical protein
MLLLLFSGVVRLSCNICHVMEVLGHGTVVHIDRGTVVFAMIRKYLQFYGNANHGTVYFTMVL